MIKKFEWGTDKKCGVIGCDKQVNWEEFTSYLACENHRNRKWGLCEVCQNEKITHAVYYNINSDRKAEQSLKEVREGINFQKEIISYWRIFLVKNISDSLHQKLDVAYKKCQEAEKNIPELERLTQEYWEKKIAGSSDFVREKGGQQTNIYECNLCDNCGNEVNAREQKLKSDYQLNVLNKLIAFDSETSAQIEKEIGKDEAQKIAYEATFYNEKIEREQTTIRYNFLSKMPFFKSKKSAERDEEKVFFQKLKQYFQDHQIMQIYETGWNNVIWYANGNIEEKDDYQIAERDKLRTYFFRTRSRSLSLHEINNVLTSLEQEPSPSEKEEETPLNRNAEYVLIKNSLEKIGKNELISRELVLNSNASTNTDNSPSGSKYLWLVGGITLGVMTCAILVFLLRQKKRKIK